MEIEFEELTHQNFSDACQIDRDDIPEDYVDTASTIMNITDYGLIHHCIGHSFVVKYHERPIGLILLGEAIPLGDRPARNARRAFLSFDGLCG